MPTKGQQKEPERLRKLYLVPTSPVEPVGLGPPSAEIVLTGVYNAALKEGWFLVDTIDDLLDLASRVMTSVIEPLEADPWFLSNKGKRIRWAKKAARHLFLDDQKAEVARKGREPRLTMEVEMLASIWSDTERQVASMEESVAVQREFARFSEHQQEILTLYIEEDLGPKEIAAELGTTPGTISEELRRMFKRFRVALTGTNTTGEETQS